MGDNTQSRTPPTAADDDSTVELTTDGTNFITIPAGKVFCFEAFQTTWNRTDGAHQVCRFTGGVIRNSGGVVTLVKTPTVIARDGTENQITFADDDANDRLAVTIHTQAAARDRFPSRPSARRLLCPLRQMTI
jgi:hypothetical protein